MGAAHRVSVSHRCASAIGGPRLELGSDRFIEVDDREGEFVLVNKLAYDLKLPFTTHHLAQWSNPCRGDIAVFFSPSDGERLIKRGDRSAR